MPFLVLNMFLWLGETACLPKEFVFGVLHLVIARPLTLFLKYTVPSKPCSKMYRYNSTPFPRKECANCLSRCFSANPPPSLPRLPSNRVSFIIAMTIKECRHHPALFSYLLTYVIILTELSALSVSAQGVPRGASETGCALHSLCL